MRPQSVISSSVAKRVSRRRRNSRRRLRRRPMEWSSIWTLMPNREYRGEGGRLVTCRASEGKRPTSRWSAPPASARAPRSAKVVNRRGGPLAARPPRSRAREWRSLRKQVLTGRWLPFHVKTNIWAAFVAESHDTQMLISNAGIAYLSFTSISMGTGRCINSLMQRQEV